ncbi:LOB domain-containing protein 38 [Senna tora]|uniref:LOB domain-containing protein 38 n=1 Tax=Senna tora TaxID=362788 RepID=A0A834WMB1_9FABA|nr:LOB domain-containing protein 38 [Senna tora]
MGDESMQDKDATSAMTATYSCSTSARAVSFTLTSFLQSSQIDANVFDSTVEVDRFASFGEVWRKIWKAQVPSKIKIFLWRTYRKVLPVRANLAKRGVEVEDGCPLGCPDEETVLHALVHKLLTDFKGALNGGPSTVARDASSPRWKPPPFPKYKVNVDAGLKLGLDGGVGCVIRDSSGRCLTALADRVPFSRDVDILEAKAVLVGLELARDLRIKDVVVEGDSSTVLRALSDGAVLRTPLGSMLLAIREVCVCFRSMEFSWVPRLVNGVVDKLASIGTLAKSTKWIDTPEAQGHATVFVAKFFGRAGLMSFISNVPQNQRPALFQSLLFEACGRTVNPVNGAVGLLWTGNWHVCQAAVETVLRGGTLRPIPELLAADAPTMVTDEASEGEVTCTDMWNPSSRFTNSRSNKFSTSKRKRSDESGKPQTADLDLRLTPTFLQKASGYSCRPEIGRPGTPSMNSEESVTTTACLDSGLGDHYAQGGERKLLNLFM